MTLASTWFQVVAETVRGHLEPLRLERDYVELNTLNLIDNWLYIVVQHRNLSIAVGTAHDLSAARDKGMRDALQLGEILAWDVREPVNLTSLTTFRGIKWRGHPLPGYEAVAD
ncbi:hypothetical protein [Actinokineospora sp. NBRC 105648]|uniref:hypothetical protein n=1 Tax=Actinokineospora sp. NBRC 105648 TaxID=3032206 RepID=UPI0024A5154F|nr:hypothetical protein [Actinokineospora sp. NBRC 105648]GLZ37010.1 hypothetical protein Acsp05_06350 [Actinokineospora sp. NBRC 105648]